MPNETSTDQIFYFMKTPLIQLLFLFVILIFNQPLCAQNDAESQAFWVHEDPVYPAKVSDYEAYCQALADNCRASNISTADWFTISTDDLRYFHLSPISNMADLDKSRFSALQDKMGDKEFNELFDNFDNCYDSHSDYIIHLDPELSYMPEGIEIMTEGQEYRELQFWHATPQNYTKLLDMARAFKKLYSEKNSPEHYRVYRSGFGAPGQFIIVSISAKSAAEYERVYQENKVLLGAERDKIYNELLSSIIKVEKLNGYMRADLSYHPKAVK